MLKYMCYRKPENLISLLNNVINRSMCDIILKILMIDNQNVEELTNFDNLKTKIIYTLLSNFYSKDSLEEITNTKDIFIELIETTKNFEFLVSENFLIIFFSTLVSIKNFFALKEYFLVLIALIKQFKTEYEKAQKFVSSLSLSKYFFKKIINKKESKIIENNNLSLEIDVILIGKINSSLDFILDIFVNISNEKMNSIKNFLQHKYHLYKLNF